MLKILVCIKQVPDTNEIKIDPVKGTLIREGVPSIMNPDDKAGLEAALRLKDKYGANVTVISMGPMQAQEIIREAIAMGADDGYLLSDFKFAGADTLATSTALCGAIKNFEYDLVIMGRQAIDGDTAQVGPETAELLGIPQISYAASIDYKGGYFIVERKVEDRIYVLKAKAPIVVTVLGESMKPRYMNVARLIDVYRNKQINVWTAEKTNTPAEKLGLKGSPTQVKESFGKQLKAAGTVMDNLDPQEAAKVIAKTLAEKHYL
jgi:electron transfer flavoprotein beta subunit